jgi:hypothetical protein
MNHVDKNICIPQDTINRLINKKKKKNQKKEN